jgi:enamine deaminase RidA (YjgF/YER057c/UK114 family)
VRIEASLRELGLVLPEPVKPPPGVRLPFAPVRVIGDRALISGHGPQHPDGSIAGPFGKLGADVTVEQGYQAARLTALSMLGSLSRELVLELFGDAGGHARSAVGMAELPFNLPVELEAEVRIAT